jgi:hypothetical protein
VADWINNEWIKHDYQSSDFKKHDKEREKLRVSKTLSLSVLLYGGQAGIPRQIQTETVDNKIRMIEKTTAVL